MGACVCTEKPIFEPNKKLTILEEKEAINHYLNNKISEIHIDKEDKNIKDNTNNYIVFEMNPTEEYFELLNKYCKF